MNPKIFIGKSKYLLFLSAAFICTRSFSQETNEKEVTNVTKVTIINPGVSHEIAIGKRQTLYGQFFINTSATTTVYYNTSQNNNITFYFDPALALQLRHYYNGRMRTTRGKRTAMNSMNYLAAFTEVFFSRIPFNSSYEQNNRRAISTLGAVWGLQRNYKGRFSLDLNLGVGYRFAKSTIYSIPQPRSINTTVFSAIGQLNIGIWLNKRKE